MEDRKPPRRILPLADDEGDFMCYMCEKHFETVKFLYNHMVGCHESDWRDILPEDLADCDRIIVRHKLFDPISSDSDESFNVMINEEECSSSFEYRGMVDFTKLLLGWSVNGKARSKRGRPEVKVNGEVVPEVVGLPEKKAKVAEAVETEKDGVLPEVVGCPAEGGGKVAEADVVAEGGGKVVFGFDLNDPAPEW